jgi:3-deoxy-manno-octulosonate cytidylyltransferase (CMP-KDO synthetase)
VSGAIAVIPARFASVRFPGKALAVAGGKPLIQHVWERAAELRSVQQVVVATDDERIRETVHAFGGTAVLTRGDHPTGTDRVAEAARSFAAEVVVNLQGDEPVFDTKSVDELVRLMLEDASVLMGTLAHPIERDEEHRDPNRVKVVLDQAGYALYFSRAPIPFVRRAGLVGPLRHLGLYVFRADFLQRFAKLPSTPLEQTETLEQLRALEHGVRIRVLTTPMASIGVDTPADLAALDELLARRRDPVLPGAGGRS